MRNLNRYMSSDSYKINEKLYNNVPLDDNDNNFISNLDNALKKLPKYEGVVNRSMFIENQTQLNKILNIFNNKDMQGSWASYLSSSKEIYDENDNLRFIIKSKTGRDISMFNEKEQEVLFERNTKFKLIKIYSKDKKIFAELEEIVDEK